MVCESCGAIIGLSSLVEDWSSLDAHTPERIGTPYSKTNSTALQVPHQIAQPHQKQGPHLKLLNQPRMGPALICHFATDLRLGGI
jgi:hypothetical protein